FRKDLIEALYVCTLNGFDKVVVKRGECLDVLLHECVSRDGLGQIPLVLARPVFVARLLAEFTTMVAIVLVPMCNWQRDAGRGTRFFGCSCRLDLKPQDIGASSMLV